jgi:hypothetical protein
MKMDRALGTPAYATHQTQWEERKKKNRFLGNWIALPPPPSQSSILCNAATGVYVRKDKASPTALA